jgi:cytochrome c553
MPEISQWARQLRHARLGIVVAAATALVCWSAPALFAGFPELVSALAQPAAPSTQGSAVLGERPPLAARVCVGCHAPPEQPQLSGQLLGRWLAPNITPDRVSGIGAWAHSDLLRYLREGRAPGRAQAGGPMGAVVENLQQRSEAELAAIVDWLARQPAVRDPREQVAASERGRPLVHDPVAARRAMLETQTRVPQGAALYDASCASCHGADGSGSKDGVFPSLYRNSAVGRRTPYNLLAVLLEGVARRAPEGPVMMPSFDGSKGVPGGLSDDELASLANFVLAQFGDPATAHIDSTDIARARAGWRGTGQASSARGQLIAVGGGPGGAGTACFRCHGLRGEGDSVSAAPRLSGLDAHYLAKQMGDYASGARPSSAMAAIARQLPASDHQSVGLYYAGQATPALYAGKASRDPSLQQQGAMLYALGSPERGIAACATCHGPGRRGLNPVYPEVIQPAAYVEVQLRLWRAGLRRNDPHDLMGEVARRMSDADIRSAAAFLEVAP